MSTDPDVVWPVEHKISSVYTCVHIHVNVWYAYHMHTLSLFSRCHVVIYYITTTTLLLPQLPQSTTVNRIDLFPQFQTEIITETTYEIQIIIIKKSKLPLIGHSCEHIPKEYLL